jgi:hypothetical protein
VLVLTADYSHSAIGVHSLGSPLGDNAVQAHAAGIARMRGVAVRAVNVLGLPGPAKALRRQSL